VAGTPFERMWDRHVVLDHGDGRGAQQPIARNG
jgi:hypothetical protein